VYEDIYVSIVSINFINLWRSSISTSHLSNRF